MKRYGVQEDGEWVRPIVRGYRTQCCDCGLVHKMDFRIRDGRIEFRAYRDGRATGGARASQKIKVKRHG